MNLYGLSYVLSDVVLYSAEAFHYLLADYNQQQLMAVVCCYLAGLSCSYYLYRRIYLKACLLALCLCWVYNGWIYYQHYYQQLNWFACYLSAACYLLSTLLLLSITTSSWRAPARKNLLLMLITANFILLPLLQLYWLKNPWFIQFPLSTPLSLSIFSLSLLLLIKSKLKRLLLLFSSLILLIEVLFLYQLR